MIVKFIQKDRKIMHCRVNVLNVFCLGWLGMENKQKLCVKKNKKKLNWQTFLKSQKLQLGKGKT